MNSSLGYSIRQAFKQAGRNRAMMITSLFSITAMLLILGLFFILIVNVNVMTDNVRDQFDVIEIYLLDDANNTDIYKMMDDIKGREYVEEVEYVSKEQALAEMKESWEEKAYLLDGLDDNPLPRSLRIKMDDMTYADDLVQEYTINASVEDIKYGKTEVEKILNITNGIQMGAIILIIFLIIVSIVVVSNTIKLTVLARGEEINIMKYVGATNWFIRGPFLIEGMLIGIIAAIIASLLTSSAYYAIVNNLGDKVLLLFSTRFVPVLSLTGNLVGIFLALGISIGAIGSLISMRRFLDV